MSRTHHHSEKYLDETLGKSRRWYAQEPSWWRTAKKHKPQRQRTRLQLKHGDFDSPFPHDKKPWIYFW